MGQLRGALFGSLIGAVAGIAWSLWGASGLDGAAAVTLSVLGAALGVVLVVLNRLADRALARSEPADSSPVTRFGRGYWVIVVGEVLAIWIGLAVLNVLDAEAGRAPWVCFVVGLHFVALGLLWQARPVMVLAVALLAIGLVLLIVALAGAGSVDTVTAWTGILAAVSFFASSIATLLAARQALSGAAPTGASGEG